MMIQRKRILYTILVCSPVVLYGQQGWRTALRVQTGYERDSNVAEAVDHGRSAEDLRLLVEFKAQRRGLSFSYQGGYQFYPSLSSENKMAHEAVVSALWPLAAQVLVGAQLWTRFKLFLNSDQDLACGFLQPYALWRLNDRASLQLGFRQDALDYAHSDYFDFAGPGLNLQLRYKMNPQWTLIPMLSWQRSVFQRYAYSQFEGTKSLLPLADRQKDGLITAGLQSEWMYRSLLLNLFYRFENNHSNSYGYAFSRHVITAMFAQQWRAWFFRGYFSRQMKEYGDALRPYLPISLDTEQEENNFIVLDVSRDLLSRLSLVGRVAWYENESPWADLYYRKTLLQVFFEWRM